MDMPEVGVAISSGAVGSIVTALVAWWKSKQPVEVKQPVEIDLKKEFVTRRDFDAHVLDNSKAHENLFGRLNRNDRETSEIKGLLTGMRDDLSAIKNKLFRSK